MPPTNNPIGLMQPILAWLHTIFANEPLVTLAIPFFTAFVAVTLRVNARPDKEDKRLIRREDVSIGFDLAIGGLVASLAHLAALAPLTPGATPPWWTDRFWSAVGMIFALIWLTIIVRRRGWTASQPPAPTWIVGVFIPLLVGVLYIYVAVKLMGARI